MSYAFENDPQAPPLQRWSVTKPEGRRYPRSLLELPTGDFISPRLTDMVRVSSDKADRSTGEVGAVVHIECKGSWFTVRFKEVDEARGFARALVDFRDEMVQ